MFDQVTRFAFKTEADHQAFLKTEPVRFLKKNIYAPRVTTKDFRKINFAVQGGKHYKTLVEKTAVKYANDMAMEEYGAYATKEQIAEFMKDAVLIAETHINDIIEFGGGKYHPSFLKNRHIKLPEFITIDGKKIQVYETKYEHTIKQYATGMSKFLANAEIFPDIGLKEFTKGIRTTLDYDRNNSEALIGKYRQANPKWGEWVKTEVDKALGLDKKSWTADNSVSRSLQWSATVYAKTALSFITSGIKNRVLGHTMILGAYKIRDHFRGWLSAMDRDFRAEVRMSGATELGLRHILTLKGQKALNAIFKLGGMQMTEDSNRYLSVATSRYEQVRLMKTISNPNSSARNIAKAKKRLGTFYHLNKNTYFLFFFIIIFRMLLGPIPLL